MKRLMLVGLCFCSIITNATNYYISTSQGDDSRSSTQAQNPSTPWKTIAKLNSFFASLSPGDAILFNRGEEYPGALNISRSGSSGSPITIGAYGSGAAPVITGFQTVTSWTSVSNGVYESTLSGGLSTLNMVLYNGSFQPIGRWPKASASDGGYLPLQSHSGTSSITSNAIASAANFTGGEVVIRSVHWVIQRGTVTSQSSNTVNYSPFSVPMGSIYQPTNNFGFFFQNHVNACTAAGDWAYDGSSHKIKMNFGGGSAGSNSVKAANVDYLVTIPSRSYINFENLAFTGANLRAFNISGSNHIQISGCDISYTGEDAIYCNNSGNNTISLLNSNISYSNNNGITGNSSSQWTIRGNTFTNTGTVPGMGVSGDGQYIAMAYIGGSSTVELNTVTNTGYVCIHFVGGNSVIQKNLFNSFAVTKDDAGAIYTWSSGQGGTKILNNIIINGIGAPNGANTTIGNAYGIYMDDNATGVEIAYNSVANCARAGFYHHNDNSHNIHHNTFYNNAYAQMIFYNNGNTISSLTHNNNIFFARTASQNIMSADNTKNSGISGWFSASDNNYYCRPLNENSSFEVGLSSGWTHPNLSGWKSLTGKDGGSKGTPITLTDVNKIRFEYNATNQAKTISLGANYIDVANTSYNGSITLQPYTSAVLLQTSGTPPANQSPNADAGADKTITLPANSVSLTGSGTDPDGAIASYSWTRVSGPTQLSILNSTSASTGVNNLIAGVYELQLTVTDNSGATDRDTVRITVNPAIVNQLPTANAGTDISIQLPTITVSLNGSGSDPDGSIASYSWAKISGPGTFSILSPASALTSVISLIQGTYQFQLTVTDNAGGIDRDTVVVSVNAAPPPNQLPVANAGNDVTITLPTNSTALVGSGSDQDGSISTYRWTKVSGPTQFNIGSPNSAQTSITNLAEGTYQFQLTVTDDEGATGADVIVITVNPAPAPPPNQAPTANAGNNITITLPTNSATVNGSGTDADGTIAAYTWTKASGPTQFNIVSANSASTSINNLVQGTYQFQLKVTDDDGATATDVVVVTVNAAPPNQLPTANAGSNKTITLPTNSVSLTGSGTDADGTIAIYNWTKTSGPSQFTIVSAGSAITTINNLVEGTYQFQLQVTDDDGGTGTDIVQVTVNPAPPNQLPTANAGSNKTITLPTSSVSVTGSGTDADGTIAGYSWTWVAGPAQYTIASPSNAQTSITNLVQGTYQFQLKVTDDDGGTATDIVVVTVNAAPNQAPSANAGTDITIQLPTNSVSLTGSGTDADGTIASYAWTKTSGPTQFTIVSANNAQTTINNLAQGTYQFQLQVTDDDGATDTDVITVIVNAQPANQNPTANAGSDITIQLPTNTVTVNGSGTDPDGTIVSYSWSRVSGPTTFNIVSGSSASTVINNLAQGTYTFQLTVTDNRGGTATDNIRIIVNAAPVNQLPTANAGSNKTITLPTNSVGLTGSGTDNDGTIAAYSWTRVSGPTQFTIVTPNNANTTINGLVEGTYQFQLEVTDDDGGKSTDIVSVIVNPAPPNQLPVVEAGNNITITLPTSSVTLNGTGSDADGTITSYAWTKTSGPTQFTIVSAGSAQTTVNNLAEGTYQFQLQVTDNRGATATDVVTVTVNPAPNVAPAANTGPDITITLPTNTVTVNGAGTDVDGTIASYAWTRVSGPTTFNIVSGSSASTVINNLVQGTYTFQLRVTDNRGGTATDNIRITVNAAPSNQLPTANAGSNKTITLPTNSVALTGSGTDNDGTIAAYSWTRVSGPTQFTIVTPANANTTINGLVEGTYQFQLEVTDNDGGKSTDIVSVIVNPAPPNQLPVVEAGNNITITLPTSTVTLNGSGSDADGTIADYTWTKTSGPTQFNIVSPDNAQTTVNNLAQGTYQFQLEVTDDDGGTATDVVTVTVNPAPNQNPTANAGTDITIQLPTNTVTVNGSGTDPDGTIASYAWTRVSGPTTFNIVSGSSASTVINNLVQGTYTFQLRVTDNRGGTATDNIRITVNAAPPNNAPTANAGSNVIITLPTSSVTLNGGGTDGDGTIAGYVWTKISGPSQFNIVSGTSASTVINNLAEGSYQFQLQVTDDDGATSTDVVTITVNAAAPPPNQAPSANAGTNKTITLPTNTVTLNGSGTDADGTIAGYAWTRISGPTQFDIVSAGAASTAINNLVQGTYQFQLEVTDDDGSKDADVVIVTVNPAPPNQLPVANAGNNITITLPTSSVTLNGSGTDADGMISGYAWTKISGPTQFNIVSAATAQTTVNNLAAGTYQFELQVTDNDGGTSTDVVTVTVNAAPNQDPIAQAGTDITITLPTNSVTVNGSGTDDDGTIASYAWIRLSGPTQYNIVSAGSASTVIDNLVQGIYTFQLRVTDNDGATDNDNIRITVLPAPPNTAPVANAGSNVTITLPTSSVTLSGSGTDNDGTIAGYAWTKISGPAQFNIVSAGSALTTVDGLAEGTYQFQLEVTDDDGSKDADVVIVTVNPAPPNQLPVANAGNNISITLPTSSVTLNGSGTDADGTISGYAWTKISGPTQFNIVSAATAQTTVNNLAAGTYQFELQVTDNDGGTSTDVVTVTVNDAPNEDPLANAGTDITITLPTNSVTVNGSGTDDDGTIASYAWIRLSGPTQYNIVSAGSASTVIDNLVQGIYTFQLRVTDNDGATDNDNIRITVLPAPPNTAPVANAGSNVTITLPTSSVTLSGSGTDNDGTIAGYAWTKISGPAQFNIVSAGSALTTVDGLAEGTYQFQIEVTDDDGSKDADVVIVTVNPAPPNQLPVANAGNNISITLPTSSVTLNGSGTDADGTISGYAWTKISGPTQFNIVSAATAQTTVNNLAAGTYQFELQVTDNDGGTSTDVVTVTVNAAPNQDPIAQAGPDITISLPANTVTLNGAGVDLDGTIASYAWVRFSGPSQYNIADASSAQTDVTNLVQGTYYFQLRVTDNGGETDVDYVKVTVLPAPPNQAPAAEAGGNKIIALPTDSVLLTGSGTDADGVISSYAWTKVAGPDQFTIVSAASAETMITGLAEGTYQFQLTVTDDDGAISTDVVIVTVNPAPPPPPNINPDADAGNNRTITLPRDSLMLNGNGSDVDGTIASYAWTKISGPDQYTIVYADSARTRVRGLVAGVYQFQLTVTDNAGGTGSDVMIVTVNPAPNNELPDAEAGNNRTIILPTDSLTLTGSGTDEDGTVVKYTWTMIDGPSSYTIVSASSAETMIRDLVAGVYTFELEVTDNDGGVGTDVVLVTVNPEPPNENPDAFAGANITITLPVNTVTLNGIGMDDDGTIASYNWTKFLGPDQYTIVSPDSASTVINNLAEGSYYFSLSVTDNDGGSGWDIVKITVNPRPANVLPTADAGNNRIITLPVNSLTLTGIGADTDGTIVSYAWTKVSGPLQYNIVSAGNAQTTIDGLVQGTYQFQLLVTDDRGGTATSIVYVTVNPAPIVNRLPTANAGEDITITLPQNSVGLLGSGTDVDGVIVGFIWAKVSGPVGSIISPSNTAATMIRNLVQGVYKFRLQVVDNSGAVDHDTVTITVLPAPNQPPVANAGADTVIALGNSVALAGTGQDADGVIAGYSWTMVSGPADYNISDAESANTTVSSLSVGVYQFALTVTDDQRATASDTVRVTVIDIPMSTATVYPNPVNSIMNIKIESKVPVAQTSIVIFDVNGKRMYMEDFLRTTQILTKQVDVSRFPNGTYFVYVYSDEKPITIKVVKQ